MALFVGQGETLVLMCDGTSVISGVTGAMATSVSDFTVNNLKVPVCVSATHLAAENVTITQAVTELHLISLQVLFLVVRI